MVVGHSDVQVVINDRFVTFEISTDWDPVEEIVDLLTLVIVSVLPGDPG